MPLFVYKAKNIKNKIIEETIQAINREEAAATLKADGLQVLTIKGLDNNVNAIFNHKISLSDKAAFCRFLATMLRAGLPLHEAVEILKEESENKKMKKILAEMNSQIRKGKSLSSIFSQYKDVFDPVFLTMVKAGEESGTLEQTFSYLAEQIAGQYEFSQTIKGSLMYPIVIIIAMIGVGFLMMGFVLPRIAEVFLNMKIDMPLITRVVLNFGKYVGDNLVLVFSINIGFFILLFFIFSLKKTRQVFLRILAKIPAVKKIMDQIDVARFSRTLSVLLKNGVPIVDALNVSADTLVQSRFKRKARQFSAGVAKGEPLSRVLIEGEKVFPLIMTQTIRTGEKTGSLEEVLQELADYYEKEVDFRLKRLTSLIEPVLMLLVGVVVGAMVILIVAPIYSIVGGLQNSMQR